MLFRSAELEDAIATANAQARRDQELIDIWRERAMQPVALQQEAIQHQAQLHQAAALQQAQSHLQQMLANQSNGQHNQQLAAQNAMVYGQGPELWCNCVPARHDMLLPGR